MKLTTAAAVSLADEPGLTGTDLRVWLLLVDRQATPAELARDLGVAPTNVASSCRKLMAAGWIDLAEEVGRSKRYTARAVRNPNAAAQGQMRLKL